MITERECRTLVKRLHQGDTFAGEKLVNGLLPLLKSIIKKENNKINGFNGNGKVKIDYEEVIAESQKYLFSTIVPRFTRNNGTFLAYFCSSLHKVVAKTIRKQIEDASRKVDMVKYYRSVVMKNAGDNGEDIEGRPDLMDICFSKPDFGFGQAEVNVDLDILARKNSIGAKALKLEVKQGISSLRKQAKILHTSKSTVHRKKNEAIESLRRIYQN